MAKYRSQKSRLTSVVRKTETAIAPSTARHHTQRPLPHAIPWIGANVSLRLVSQKRVPVFFFAKSRYRDDNHGTGADFVNVLPFRRGERASKTQQSTGRAGETKG